MAFARIEATFNRQQYALPVLEADGDASLDLVPAFMAADGTAHHDILAAAHATAERVNLDVVAVASMLSFQYVVDGRSLLSGIGRRSWMTVVTDDNGEIDPALVAPYGRRVVSPRQAASELLSALAAELERAFAGADRVTVLLSGGLDSRLAATVLAKLAREGRVTDNLRAMTWGLPDSRDLHFGQRVAAALGMSWAAIDLGPSDLVTNIDAVATGLGALVSPVHLHATVAMRALAWRPGDRILVSTLGNGIGRGTYLWRHLSYTRPIEPIDWLGLLRPDVSERARAELAREIRSFRARFRACSSIAQHECEMLAHYVSGQLLPVYGLLGRTAAPVHQSLSDPRTYRFLWSLSPLLRTSELYRAALRQCSPKVAEIPYAATNRPLYPFARPEPNNLAPFVHRYPRWIAHDLATLIDDALAPEWWNATGLFDGAAIGRVWSSIRHHPDPHPQTSYVLLWFCALRRLMEPLSADRLDRGRGPTPAAQAGPAPTAASPPWGFAGRPPERGWRRAASLPRQAINIAACHIGATAAKLSRR